ncbi:MAG: hypothetical protein HY392_01435 [Candidatus Diapherotrites archaeon]|nr:hypothetical protein [Candidatus Diapherotrites archaeon]
MDVLIPIISKHENDPQFLASATKEAGKVFLLVIVDANVPDMSFGFTATEIGQGNTLMREIKRTLQDSGKEVVECLEWGETIPKIINFAKLKKIRRVALKKQDNHWFKKLARQLHEEKIETEII